MIFFFFIDVAEKLKELWTLGWICGYGEGFNILSTAQSHLRMIKHILGTSTIAGLFTVGLFRSCASV